MKGSSHYRRYYNLFRPQAFKFFPRKKLIHHRTEGSDWATRPSGRIAPRHLSFPQLYRLAKVQLPQSQATRGPALEVDREDVQGCFFLVAHE